VYCGEGNGASIKIHVTINIDAATSFSNNALYDLNSRIHSEFDVKDRIDLTISSCLYSSVGIFNSPQIITTLSELRIPILFSSGIFPSMCALDNKYMSNYDVIVQINTDNTQSTSCIGCATIPFVAQDLSLVVLESNCAKALVKHLDLHGMHSSPALKGDMYYDRSSIYQQLVSAISNLEQCNIPTAQCPPSDRDGKTVTESSEECNVEPIQSSPQTLSQFAAHFIRHNPSVISDTRDSSTSNLPSLFETFRPASPDKYHESGVCNLWWPLNHSEVFTFSSRPTTTLSGSVEEQMLFIFACPGLTARLKGEDVLYALVEPVDEGGTVRKSKQRVLQVERIMQSPTDATALAWMLDIPEAGDPAWHSQGDKEQLHLRLTLALHSTSKKTNRVLSVFDVKVNVIFSADSNSVQQSGQYFSNLHPLVNTLYTRDKLGSFLNAIGHSRGTFVEIGVNRGEFANVMMRSWFGNRYVLVDPWFPTNGKVVDYVDAVTENDRQEDMHQAIRIAKQFGTRPALLRMTSTQAAVHFVNNSIDLVYIDGLHHYQGVMEDMMAWYPKIKDGGIMLGHDYLLNAEPKTIFTVKPAVDEFAR
jgi:hypothetical protein